MRCGRPNNAGMIQKQILNKTGLCAVLGHKLATQAPGLNNPQVVFGRKTLFTCRGCDQMITRFIIRERKIIRALSKTGNAETPPKPRDTWVK